MGLGPRTICCLAVLAVTACGGDEPGSGGTSGRNALAGILFGSGDAVADARAEAGDPLVDQVVSMSLSPTPGGAIVSAVGLPPTQGYWDADLVPVPTEDTSLLLLEFRLLPPLERRPVGTQPSREVLAGTFLSRQDLAGIRTVAVRAGRNQATSQR